MTGKTKEYAAYILHILTFIAYFFLLFVLDIPQNLNFLQYIGIVFFILGIALLILSLRSLLRNKSGDLITTGVFSLVRHPMYLGGMVLFLAMGCFLPHWIMVLLVSINLILIYRFMLDGDRSNVDKFGEEYQMYMERVPRMNLVAGIVNWLRRGSINDKG